MEERRLFECLCGESRTHVELIAKKNICLGCRSPLHEVVQTQLFAFFRKDNEEVLSGRRKLILDEFKKAPGTDSEIMQRLGFKDPNKVRPRRKELFDMELLIKNDKRICKVTGELVTEWAYKGVR